MTVGALVFQIWKRAAAPGEGITARARPQTGRRKWIPSPGEGQFLASVEETQVTQTMIAFLG